MSLISLFYKIDKKYVVNELNNSDKLRKQYGFKSKLDYHELCEVFSRFNEYQILEFVIKRLNKEFQKEKRGKRTIWIDSTDMQFDINIEKKYYDDEYLDKKGFKLGYSSSKSYYIGGKLTLTIDHDTFQHYQWFFTQEQFRILRYFVKR